MIQLLLLLIIVALIGLGLYKLANLTSKQKREIPRWVDRQFLKAEQAGLIKKQPGFQTDYLDDYPELKILEDHYATIREECLAVLVDKDKMVDMKELGGDYTSGKIHQTDWKTFVFKTGQFIEENCKRCPQTADLIRQVPGVYNAFFSVLGPGQRIEPHWGYYKGFIRYHLGVIIPNNNKDKSCYIQVNDNDVDNAKKDKALIDKGDKYYWREGEGVLFDDTYLHQAANESDSVRVVLFMDLRRKMPFYLQMFNRLFLGAMLFEPSVKKMRQNAKMKD